MPTFVCVYIAVFLLAYKKSTFIADIDNTRLFIEKIFWQILALVAMIFATYTVEVCFGIFAIIAIFNLLFARGNLKKSDRIFNYIIIANTIIYGLLYYFNAYKNAVSFYHVDVSSPIAVFTQNPLLVLVLIFAFIRAYFVLFKKDRRHIFYDGILFASAGGVFAYLMLRLYYAECYAISMILFLPVLVFWTALFYDKKRYLICGLLCLFVLSSSVFSLYKTQGLQPANYTQGRTTMYELLKIDMMAKYGAPVLFYYDGDYAWEDYYYKFMVQYMNSPYFETKYLDKSEIKNDYMDNIRVVGPDAPIDKNAIYLSASNLKDTNEKFSDFLNVGTIDGFSFYREHFYIFVHKDRLENM
jgi:hypothetical protein